MSVSTTTAAPATEAAAPAAPAPTTEAAPTPTPTPAPTAPVEGSFIAEALKMLAPHQEGAPKVEAPAPVEAPKAEAPKAEAPKAEAPAAKTEEAPVAKTEEPPKAEAHIDDEEGKKAEEDIKRETAQMPAPQKAAFTKLRYELRDKNRQLKAALEAQKEQGGEKTADPEITAEIARLKAENEEAKAKLSKFDDEFFATRVELTDEFKTQVSAPREEVAKTIGSIAERYDGLDSQEVVRAVQSADPKQVAKVTADMNEYDRFQFYKLVDEYQRITRVERGMRENAKQTLEKLDTERRTKTEQQTAKEREEWTTALSRTWEKLTEDFPVLAPIEGAESWNQQLEKVKSFAAPDRFGKLTTQEKAESLYRAAAFPVLVSELEQARAELKEATEKLGKIQGATPGVETSGGGSNSQTMEVGGVTIPANTDIATATAMLLKKHGIA